MKKKFICYDTVRDNGILLARRIFDDGFKPTIVYMPLRGGAYLGNIIIEFLRFAYGNTHTFLYGALIASSYDGLHQSSTVELHGWTYPLENLGSEAKVLFIDDIYDSGKTINCIVEQFLNKNIPRENIKIAVHDYKVFLQKKQPIITPDYWCQKHEISSDEDDIWIHYMSHELKGLSREELEVHYFKKNPTLRAAFEGLII